MRRAHNEQPIWQASDTVSGGIAFRLHFRCVDDHESHASSSLWPYYTAYTPAIFLTVLAVRMVIWLLTLALAVWDHQRVFW